MRNLRYRIKCPYNGSQRRYLKSLVYGDVNELASDTSSSSQSQTVQIVFNSEKPSQSCCWMDQCLTFLSRFGVHNQTLALVDLEEKPPPLPGRGFLSLRPSAIRTVTTLVLTTYYFINLIFINSFIFPLNESTKFN